MQFRIKIKVLYPVLGLVLMWGTAARAADDKYENSDVESSSNQLEERVWGRESEGFKLSLKTEKVNYLVGETIDLSVVLENIDRETVMVRSQSGVTYGLKNFRPDGTAAPLTAKGEESKRGIPFISIRGASSEPGEKHEEKLEGINTDFDMTQVGDYQLHVWRQIPKREENIENENDRTATITSNVISLRIDVPDEAVDETQAVE